MSFVIEMAVTRAQSEWRGRASAQFVTAAEQIRDHLRTGDHDGLIALTAVFDNQPDQAADDWFAEATRLITEDAAREQS